MESKENKPLLLTEEDVTLRVNRAVELFKQGFNCSQSVVAAYADLYGYSKEQALKWRLHLVAESDVCDKLVERLVECSCWLV